MRIPLSKPNIGKREIELVTHVLRSGRLSIGPFLEQFEKQFAEILGRDYAIAVNSGTSALHLCAASLDIGPKDEVITTPFTFVASTNCILYQQAMPSFVDIDPNTLNIDPIAIRRAIERDYMIDKNNRVVNRLNGRTLKAILPVHVFGLPCDMAAILKIADDYGLYVIEDACEALGGLVNDFPAGTHSEAAAFAFYPNKQMTTGEGGMIVTDDPEIARICRTLRNQGRDESSAWLRHTSLGFNYRLSELHCALGLAQLEQLGELLKARAALAEAYAKALSGVSQIALPWNPQDGVRSWFAYVIQMQGAVGPAMRDRLMAGLQARGIACQAYFPCVHLQPYFKGIRLHPARPLPHAEAASRRCLALPFFPSMKKEEIDEVCSSIRDILAERPAVGPKRARITRVQGAA